MKKAKQQGRSNQKQPRFRQRPLQDFAILIPPRAVSPDNSNVDTSITAIANDFTTTSRRRLLLSESDDDGNDGIGNDGKGSNIGGASTLGSQSRTTSSRPSSSNVSSPPARKKRQTSLKGMFSQPPVMKGSKASAESNITGDDTQTNTSTMLTSMLISPEPSRFRSPSPGKLAPCVDVDMDTAADDDPGADLDPDQHIFVKRRRGRPSNASKAQALKPTLASQSSKRVTTPKQSSRTRRPTSTDDSGDDKEKSDNQEDHGEEDTLMPTSKGKSSKRLIRRGGGGGDGGEYETRKTRSQARSSKKMNRTQFASALDKLKKRRQGVNANMSSSSSSSSSASGSSSSGSSDSDDSFDHRRLKNLFATETEEDRDFIVEVDEKEEKAQRDAAPLPDMFRVDQAQHLATDFMIYAQFILSLVLVNDFADTMSPKDKSYFIPAVQKVTRILGGYRTGLASSQVWNQAFKRDLDRYSMFSGREMFPRSGTCAACMRSNHKASHAVRLGGDAYELPKLLQDQTTEDVYTGVGSSSSDTDNDSNGEGEGLGLGGLAKLLPQGSLLSTGDASMPEKNKSSGDGDDADDDDDDDGHRILRDPYRPQKNEGNSTTSKGNPTTKETTWIARYTLGRNCFERCKLYHKLRHFTFHLVDKIQRHAKKARDERKERGLRVGVVEIHEALEKARFFQQLWADLDSTLDDLSNLDCK